LIQSQTVQESAAEVLRTEAENAAGQLQKSSNDAALRFRARLLLAEIQLERRDFAGFELRLGTAATSAVSQFDEATVAALKIRALLKQGQPSDALQEFVAASQAKLSLTQELQTLRLQGLLQLLELLTQLEESPQRASLTENTVREFEQLKDKTLMLTCGVWRERCVRLIGRFERVQLVGAQAAADLDYVALMVERGHLSEARQTLQILIQRTGPRRPELTAVLLMQAGSLSVQMKDWGTAVNELTQATEQFQTINDLPRAASADLLKVFAMGQQWNASESPQITELTYRAAIENHLQTFPQQPTIATVREWRARLIRSSSPLEAAKELLDVIALQTETTASETTASETSDSDTSAVASDTRIAPDEKLLNLVGDHLLEALAKVTPNEKNELAELDELAGQFEDRIRQIPRASEVTEQTPRERILRELLEFQRMALMLRRPLGRDTDWKSLGTQARDALTVMEAELEHTNDRSAEDSESAESEEAAVQSEHITLVRNAVPVCHGLIILSGMRQLAGSSEFEKSRSAVTDLPQSDRLQLTRQMIHQLFSGEGVASATTAIPGPAPVPRPGDVQFAHFLITLIASDELSQASGNVIDARIEELQLLKLLSQAAESRAVLDRRLNELLSMTMTDAQLKEVVTIVVDDTTRGNAASENSRREFWRAVQKRTKPGQDAWLEASLQMALNAEADGDRKEATRILGVVSVLHPDWGSPQRKARADELLDQLRAPR
jgi:hypothetical protein